MKFLVVNIVSIRYIIGMSNDISQIIERLSSIRRGVFRNVAARLNVPLIHAEILDYLASCNRYSNTPLAVVEYLGQTKGSISQSLKKMEDNDLIFRKASKEDKRSSNLFLTDKGQKFISEISNEMPEMSVDQSNIKDELVHLLKVIQDKQDRRGFAVCHSCRYNEKISGSLFKCGLTKEELSKEETELLCREHEYA